MQRRGAPGAGVPERRWDACACAVGLPSAVRRRSATNQRLQASAGNPGVTWVLNTFQASSEGRPKLVLVQ